MKGLLVVILMMSMSGCVSQIFLDGPTAPSSSAPDVRIVHVTPVPITCPQTGMGTCYLVEDGQHGSERLLEAPPGLLQYVAGSDYVVEITEHRGQGDDPSIRWVVNRVVDHHPRAR